jgi:hypothetical protein
MAQVKEFYNKLPEGDQKAQFNNPEGAKTIWQFLESQSSPQAEKTTRRKPGSTLNPVSKKAPAQDLIKRSEILAMDDKTYKFNLSRINRAYQEGRVIDDV